MAGRNNPRTKPKGRAAVSKKVTTKTVSRGRNTPRSSNTTVRTSGSAGSSTIKTTAQGGRTTNNQLGNRRSGTPRTGGVRPGSTAESITRSGGTSGPSIPRSPIPSPVPAMRVSGALAAADVAFRPSPLGSGTRRGGERIMTGTEAAGATKGIDKVSAQRKAPAAPSGSVTGVPSRPSSGRERPTRPGQETSGRPQPSRPISRTPDYAKPGGAMGQGNKEPSYVGPKPKVAEKINKTQPTQAKSVTEAQTKKDRGYNKRSGGFGFMAGNRRGGR